MRREEPPIDLQTVRAKNYSVNLLDRVYFIIYGSIMKKAPPMPINPKYSQRIYALKPLGYLYLAGAKHTSIKAIASRLGKKHKRIYVTRSETDGINIWRES